MILQDGMIVVTRNEGNGIILGGCIKGKGHLSSGCGLADISTYNDSLRCIHQFTSYDIMQVYKITSLDNVSLEKVIETLPPENVQLIWERTQDTRTIKEVIEDIQPEEAYFNNDVTMIIKTDTSKNVSIKIGHTVDIKNLNVNQDFTWTKLT